MIKKVLIIGVLTSFVFGCGAKSVIPPNNGSGNKSSSGCGNIGHPDFPLCRNSANGAGKAKENIVGDNSSTTKLYFLNNNIFSINITSPSTDKDHNEKEVEYIVVIKNDDENYKHKDKTQINAMGSKNKIFTDFTQSKSETRYRSTNNSDRSSGNLNIFKKIPTYMFAIKQNSSLKNYVDVAHFTSLLEKRTFLSSDYHHEVAVGGQKTANINKIGATYKQINGYNAFFYDSKALQHITGNVEVTIDVSNKKINTFKIDTLEQSTKKNDEDFSSYKSIDGYLSSKSPTDITDGKFNILLKKSAEHDYFKDNGYVKGSFFGPNGEQLAGKTKFKNSKDEVIIGSVVANRE